LLIVALKTVAIRCKTVAIRCKNERYNEAARFWAKIFAVNFLLGVVTGIPMEFQFGTNWSQFARTTGGVIGQPLAMEGVFSFFLESAFLGLFLLGEKRLSSWSHWASALFVFVGSWISGFFIIVTNAWMQHPVAYRVLRQWRIRSHEFLGTSDKSLGLAAIRAQHVWCGDYRCVCYVGRRSIFHS
jgi:cytochrome d ubiquinol oxidase subunit I